MRMSKLGHLRRIPASLLVLLACNVPCVSAEQQVNAVSAPAEFAQLREDVRIQQERIDQLEAELRATRQLIEQLSARLVVPRDEPRPPEPDQRSRGEIAVPAAALPAPEPPRFDFYADTLVRLATLHQGYDGCVGCPDRNVGRFRLRFGAEGRLARGVRAVFGLASGELNDPNSVYQTFGGNLGRKTATWDRMYLVVRPTRAPWLEVQAGKFPYPWLRSSLTFDVDFYPEGASEKVSVDLSNMGTLKTVSAQGFQVIVNEQASARDMMLIGGQAMAGFSAGALSAHLTGTVVDVRHPELILRSQLDGSNVGVRNTNAVEVTNGIARYASAFRYANVILDANLRTQWPQWPLAAAIEFNKNTRAVSSRDAAQSFRLDIGRQQRARDWAFGWHVFKVEQDAIVSAMGESDWRTPSNVLQHRFAVNFMVQEHVQALFTWYRGRTLDSSVPGAALIPGWTPGRTEPFANRLYFDMAYRF